MAVRPLTSVPIYGFALIAVPVTFLPTGGEILLQRHCTVSLVPYFFATFIQPFFFGSIINFARQ